MRILRTGLRPRALLLMLLLLLSATPFEGVVRGAVAQGTEQIDATPVPSPVSATDPSGTGPWERAGCLLCAGAFLAAGGTTILGVAVTALAFPELAAACGLTCANAFS